MLLSASQLSSELDCSAQYIDFGCAVGCETRARGPAAYKQRAQFFCHYVYEQPETNKIMELEQW